MMTNDFSLMDLDRFFDSEYTRPISPEKKLEMLHTIAHELFSKRRQAVLKDQESEILNLRQMLELLAVIVSKTYVECGDAFQLADDEALILIRDQLVQYSPSIIFRNKSKRIPKQLFL